eukprot:10433487-Karenia_brevis.AAC.1
MQALGPDVWVAGPETPTHMRGLMVLGSPVGADEYVRDQGEQRIRKEEEFLGPVAQVPDF